MAGDNVNLSDLCLSCGLCCTGAIFSHAKLTREDKAALEAAGAHEGSEYTSDRLTLPCHFLSGTACSIYDQGRPQICGEYLCQLARDVEAGVLGLDEAKQVTSKARQLMAEATLALPEGTNISTGAKALVTGDTPTGINDQAAMKGRLAYFAMQALIDKRFRSDDQRLVKQIED